MAGQTKRKLNTQNVESGKFRRKSGSAIHFNLHSDYSKEFLDEEIEDDGNEFGSDDESTSVARSWIDEIESESAEQKRLRIAKTYLSRFDSFSKNLEGLNESDRAHANDDRISEELRVQRLQRKGDYFENLEDYFGSMQQEITDYATSYLNGHSRPVTCVALSKTEQFVVSGSKDNSVIMWDLNCASPSRQLLRKAWTRSHCGDSKSREGEVLSVCISFDGRYIAAGGRDKTIRIFDFRQGFAEVHCFTGHRTAVGAVAFQRDTHSLFSGSYDGCLKHWSVSDLAYIETLFGHQDAIYALDCLTKDRPISCSGDRSARIWKIEEESHLVFRGHKSSIDCVQYLDDSSFVTGAQDGALNLWKTSQKHAVSSVAAAHGFSGNSSNTTPVPRWIVSLSSISMSNVIASGSNDGYVRIWCSSLSERSLEQRVSVPIRGFVNGLALSKRLLIAGTGTEHRLGRWGTIKGNCNKVAITRFPTT